MQLIFEWDENKARANLRKHQVSFEEGKTIFNDPFLFTFAGECHSEEEERFISMGTSVANRILIAVHTEREETEDILVIRIINCRRATALERQTYEEGKG